MKQGNYLLISIFVGVTAAMSIFSCQKERVWDNPYDPDVPPDIWMPKNLQLQQVTTGIALTWQQEETRIDGFLIERKTGSSNWQQHHALEDSEARQWTDTASVPPGEKVYYRLAAFAMANTSATVEDNILPFEMVYVEGGAFSMGCASEQSSCVSDESPAQSVTLGSFSISKYEITNQQYADFMNEIGASSDGSYNGVEYLDMDDSDCQIDYSGGSFVVESGKGTYPVIEVTWYGAKALCDHYGDRLPTEAEWEFTARGGNSSKGYQYSGSNSLGEVAWYDGNSGSETHPVGGKQPNELGIYDMSGNVWEWCSDWYDSNYYDVSIQNNPQGPSSGQGRVDRGGGWSSSARYCRVAYRFNYSPGSSHFNLGFRMVLVP